MSSHKGKNPYVLYTSSWIPNSLLIHSGLKPHTTVVSVCNIRTLAGCFFKCIVCLLLLWRCVFLLDVWANGRLQATTYFPSLKIYLTYDKPQTRLLICIKNCSVRWFYLQTVFNVVHFYGTFNNILVSKVQKKNRLNNLAITECQAIKQMTFVHRLKNLQILDICM